MSRPLHEWRFDVGAPDRGERLDTFLSARLRWRSREGVQRAIRERRVEVVTRRDPAPAAARLRPSLRLRAGQEVVVRLPAPQAEPDCPAEAPPPASVVHEDDLLLVLDKPPRHNVYPSRRHRAGSLIEWAHRRHRGLWGEAGYFPTPCHRLDRETSGLVLFAKTREVRAELSRQFEAREVRKIYRAVVHGCPQAASGVIDQLLGPVAGSPVETRVGPCSGGQPARTRWRRVARHGDVTLLELEPESGRRHQLRAHLEHLGHPIVGDKLYAGGDAVFLRALEDRLTAADRERLVLDRQALHAWRLELRLPAAVVGRSIEFAFEAPLPPDISLLLEDRCVDRPLAV